MALTKKGNFRYGDTQADIKEELIRYSVAIGYKPTQFADAVCPCGSRELQLLVDDAEGAALRRCVACKKVHPIGDSAEYLADATLQECECPCGSDVFEITAGVALYPDSDDVKWLYIGCRCPKCRLTACYADWKNEFNGYQKLLDNV